MKWLTEHVVAVLAGVTVLLALVQVLHGYSHAEWGVLVAAVATLVATLVAPRALVIQAHEVKVVPEKKDEKPPSPTGVKK